MEERREGNGLRWVVQGPDRDKGKRFLVQVGGLGFSVSSVCMQHDLPSLVESELLRHNLMSQHKGVYKAAQSTYLVLARLS